MEQFEHIIRGLLGLTVMVIIAFLFSRNRKAINWRLVLIGIGLQLAIGVLLLSVEPVVNAFSYVSKGFISVTANAKEGAEFVFGPLGNAGNERSIGFIFAFQVLPVIIFFSALTSALYYLGILQIIVKGFAWVMAKTMRLSGAESISAAGNIFLGQTEAPLLVKPYISKMTRSEVMTLMCGGMATLAGSILASYITMLGGGDKAEELRYANHLLTASLMNAPAAIVLAKILVPETKSHLINTDLNVKGDKIGSNLIDAIAKGTSDGLGLALNVGAMLIAFLALIALANMVLGWVGDWTGLNETIAEGTMLDSGQPAFSKLSLEYLVGQLFRFIAFAIGIEWNDTLVVGSILGTKTIANEFVAYTNLVEYKNLEVIAERSQVLTAYALCGFANFASIGIQIGGIGGLAPNQRVTLSELGLLSVLGGTLASLMTASVAGMFV